MTADTTFLLTALILVPLVVLWLAALFHIVVRRHDLSIGSKALWSGFVIVVPYVGVLLYVTLRPPRPPTPTGGEDPTAAGAAIEQLSQLVDAHDAGSISDQEFSQHKASVFGLSGPAG